MTAMPQNRAKGLLCSCTYWQWTLLTPIIELLILSWWILQSVSVTVYMYKTGRYCVSTSCSCPLPPVLTLESVICVNRSLQCQYRVHSCFILITLSAQAVSTVVLQQKPEQRFTHCLSKPVTTHSNSSAEWTYPLFGVNTRPLFSFHPVRQITADCRCTSWYIVWIVRRACIQLIGCFQQMFPAW